MAAVKEVAWAKKNNSSLLTDRLFGGDTCLSVDLAEIGLLLGDKCLNNLYYLIDIGLLRGDVRLKDLDLMDIGLLGVGLFRGVIPASFVEIDRHVHKYDLPVVCADAIHTFLDVCHCAMAMEEQYTS